MAKATFDARCYDLAEHFLSDTIYAANTDVINELATEIQQTIEDFIADLDEVEVEDE
jgi:hypothetical protein